MRMHWLTGHNWCDIHDYSSQFFLAVQRWWWWGGVFATGPMLPTISPPPCTRPWGHCTASPPMNCSGGAYGRWDDGVRVRYVQDMLHRLMIMDASTPPHPYHSFHSPSQPPIPPPPFLHPPLPPHTTSSLSTSTPPTYTPVFFLFSLWVWRWPWLVWGVQVEQWQQQLTGREQCAPGP